MKCSGFEDGNRWRWRGSSTFDGGSAMQRWRRQWKRQRQRIDDVETTMAIGKEGHLRQRAMTLARVLEVAVDGKAHGNVYGEGVGYEW